MSTTNQSSNSVLDRVDSLRKKLAGLSTLGTADKRQISTGCKAFDCLLPGGALRTGQLVEFLSQDRGSGAGALAIHCAKRVVDESQGCLLVTDRWRRFYPPAAVARGIETKDLIVVRSSDQQSMSAAEELWALDQALRCPGVSVVLAWIDKVDPLVFRRLQLAAESGRTLALLLRPARVQSLPTWSDVQLLVKPRATPSYDGLSRPSKSPATSALPTLAGHCTATNENRFCSVTLLRQRGRAGSNTQEGTSIELKLDELGTLKEAEYRHESRTMHMAARMAHPASRRRSTGA